MYSAVFTILCSKRSHIPDVTSSSNNQQVEYAKVPVSFVNIVQLVTLTCCYCYSKTGIDKFDKFPAIGQYFPYYLVNYLLLNLGMR